ncbi:MAG: hypothetical protein Q9163_004925, partial [Psora crenata]
LDAGTHDFVPAIHAPDEPPASLEAGDAAERVREAGGAGEVFLNCGALEGGRGLREEVDDGGDFAFWNYSKRDVVKDF